MSRSEQEIASLRVEHDAVHRMYRMAGDDTVADALIDRHGQIVEELHLAGAPHPDEPDDGLDETLEYVEETEAVEYTVAISKVDSEKRLVYGVVLEPNVVDAQKEWERPETIERTAHLFLAGYNRDTGIGIQHLIMGLPGIDLVESYIAPQDLDFDGELVGDDVVRKGAWVAVVKVNDDDVWLAVKAGDITGFSVAGTATVLATTNSE